MGLVSKPYTFSAGAVIIASDHNSNFDTLYNLVNGNLTNTNISGSASIAYSKLNLTGSLLNADINSSAGIVASKLDLTAPGGIGTATPAAGKFTTLEATTTFKIGSTNQGDIFYDNGTSIVRLTPGTSGQFLQTQGTSANPQWATSGQLYAAGNILLKSADTSRSITDSSYTLKKEIQVARSGTLRIKFDLVFTSGPGGIYGKIYRNGVAVGTERIEASATTTFSEDISGWAAGDLCQVYCKRADPSDSGTIANCRIYATVPTVETVNTD